MFSRFPEWVEEDKLQAFRGQERGDGLSDALHRYIVRTGEEHGRISIPGVEKQIPSLFTFQAFFNHL